MTTHSFAQQMLHRSQENTRSHLRARLKEDRALWGAHQWYNRPIQWCMERLDGTFVTSLEKDWNDLATMRPVALAPGVVGTLPFTEPIRSLYLSSTIQPDSTLWMVAPDDEQGTSFFAFARYAMSFQRLPPEIAGEQQSESIWCYTLFGYLDGDTRVMCFLTHDGISLRTEPSSSPLYL